MIEDIQISVQPEAEIGLTRDEIASMKFTKKKEYCIRGHRMAGDNLVSSGGHLVCRACRNMRAREATERKKTGSPPPGRIKITHCKRGHEFTPENTYELPGNRRGCRTCRRLYRKNAIILKKPFIKREGRVANMKRYGLTIEDYDRMNREQGGLCAICLQTPRHSDGRPLFVDHCHATNKVRGLLCNTCNQAIGLMRENPLVLRRALNYILEGGVSYSQSTT